MPSHPRVSIIIPTLNAMATLPQVLGVISDSGTAPEVIIVDSDSEDGTREAAEAAGARVLSVRRSQFRHGATRNLAAREAAGEILVFMTQDCLPTGPDTLTRMTAALRDGSTAACFARQIARDGATPLERFARMYNYPSESRTVSVADDEPIGIRAAFFSNSCSAVRREALDALGGFPTHTIMNEDMLFAARLLKAGLTIQYVADAVVVHSHDYTTLQTFKRYFDIGVVFEQAESELAGSGSTSEGLRYVRSLFTWLWRERQYAWLPIAVSESAAKWVGTFLGRRHKSLPLSLVRRSSMHRAYWSDFT